jgi:hypothetical protein
MTSVTFGHVATAERVLRQGTSLPGGALHLEGFRNPSHGKEGVI